MFNPFRLNRGSTYQNIAFIIYFPHQDVPLFVNNLHDNGKGQNSKPVLQMYGMSGMYHA